MNFTNKTILKTLAAVAVATTVASCSDKTPAAPDDSIVLTKIGASKRYILEETAKVFDADQDILFRDSVAMIMPEKIYGKEARSLRDSILNAAFDTVAPLDDAIAAYFRNSVSEVGYSYIDAPDSLPGNDVDGMAFVEGNIFNLSPRLLTYCITSYVYFPGAAHGLTNTSYVSYLIEDEKVVTLSDIFTPEGLEALPAIINSRAKKLEGAIGPTDKITALPAQGDFYISLDGSITFVYQPYEVASYAQGAIQISFFPTELTEYLTEEGLQYFQLNS